MANIGFYTRWPMEGGINKILIIASILATSVIFYIFFRDLAKAGREEEGGRCSLWLLCSHLPGLAHTALPGSAMLVRHTTEQNWACLLSEKGRVKGVGLAVMDGLDDSRTERSDRFYSASALEQLEGASHLHLRY